MTNEIMVTSVPIHTCFIRATRINKVMLNLSPPMPHYCVSESGQHSLACRLYGAKPLSKPMLGYCQLDPRNKPRWNFNQNTKVFLNKNAPKYIVCGRVAIMSWGEELILTNCKLCKINWSSSSMLTDFTWLCIPALGNIKKWLYIFIS